MNESTDDRVTHIVVVLRDGRVATLNPNRELGIQLADVLDALARVTAAAAIAAEPPE